MFDDVNADLGDLEDIIDLMDLNQSYWKKLIGSIAGIFSRATFERSIYGDIGIFEALETIALGVMGKRALWKSLSTVQARGIPPTSELQRLIERAENQFEEIESFRMKYPRKSLSG